MDVLIAALYGACGLISAALYIPLLLRILRDDEAWRGHSITTWAGWTAIAAVNCAYAFRINHDPSYETSALLGLLAVSTTTCTLIAKATTSKRSMRWVSGDRIIQHDLDAPAAANDVSGASGASMIA